MFLDTPTKASLASASKRLLDVVLTRPEKPGSFRLELRPPSGSSTNVWELAMIVDPLFWFDVLLPKDQRVSIARAWITQQHERKRTELSSLPVEVIPDDYCKFGADCRYVKTKNGCDSKHSLWTCGEPCRKLNGSNGPCSWQCFTELRIEQLSTENWIVQARHTPTLPRDLLLIPSPVKTVSPERNAVKRALAGGWNGHMTNLELVVLERFWEQVFWVMQTVSSFTHLETREVCECVAVNFGKWESKVAQDPYSLVCHAHSHLLLTIEAHRLMTTGVLRAKFVNSKAANPLVGRNADSRDYAEDNTKELEVHRVLREEIGEIQASVSRIEIAQAGLEKLLDEKFQAMMTFLKERK